MSGTQMKVLSFCKHHIPFRQRYWKPTHASTLYWYSADKDSRQTKDQTLSEKVSDVITTSANLERGHFDVYKMELPLDTNDHSATITNLFDSWPEDA